MKYNAEKHGELLMPKDVAKRLLVKESTLAVWRSNRTGPPFHKNKAHRVTYPEKLLAQWEADQNVLVMPAK